MPGGVETATMAVPRLGEVVSPYIHALNMNSHATVNIFEAV